MEPSSAVASYFNGDGKQDLAVADFGSNGASILLDARCEQETINGRLMDVSDTALSTVLMILSSPDSNALK